MHAAIAANGRDRFVRIIEPPDCRISVGLSTIHAIVCGDVPDDDDNVSG